MNEHQTSRTLLKSPPELWAECSDAQSLGKHLGASLGEIRVTQLEPEHTVAWEGDRARGTVKLEPSGWGTRVTLTCSTAAGDGATPVVEEPAPEHEEVAPKHEDGALEHEEVAPKHEEVAPEPPLAERPHASPERPRAGLFARMMRRLAPQGPANRAVAPTPEQAAPAQSAPEPITSEATRPAPPPLQSPPVPPSPEPVASESADASETADALAAALDSLGQAHHRPFSRA